MGRQPSMDRSVAVRCCVMLRMLHVVRTLHLEALLKQHALVLLYTAATPFWLRGHVQASRAVDLPSTGLRQHLLLRIPGRCLPGVRASRQASHSDQGSMPPQRSVLVWWVDSRIAKNICLALVVRSQIQISQLILPLAGLSCCSPSRTHFTCSSPCCVLMADANVKGRRCCTLSLLS